MQNILSDYINRVDSDAESYLHFDQLKGSREVFLESETLKSKIKSYIQAGRYGADSLSDVELTQFVKLLLSEPSIDKKYLIENISQAILLAYEDKLSMSSHDLIEFIIRYLDQPEYLGDNIRMWVSARQLGNFIVNYLIEKYYFQINGMFEEALQDDQELAAGFVGAYPSDDCGMDYADRRGE